MTSRELVTRTLEFKGPERTPRQLWSLPWAWIYCREDIEAIERDFPADMVSVGGGEKELPPTQGDPTEIGELDAFNTQIFCMGPV